jgi:HD-like signal output (HDOD) protein
MSDGQQRLDELLVRARSLPLSTDGAIEAILAACDDPRSSMHTIAERIGKEPGLATIVLRQANSAHYGYGRRVETIPDAAVVLGIGTIRSLAIASAVLRLLAVDRDGLSSWRRQLLEHCVATGIGARTLARRQGVTHPEKAFLAGIIHELGTIVLTREAKPEYLHVIAQCRQRSVPLAVVEREVFGFDHAQLGAKLAEGWLFPPPICEAIASQHEPGRARLERNLAETLHVADWLAAEIGVGLVPFAHAEWPEKRAADTFGLSEHNIDELKQEVLGGLSSWTLAGGDAQLTGTRG